MEVGLRVVRGPDWTLDNSESDGGEGFVGTVVEVGGRSSRLPEDLVWVQWDSGIRHDHRAGYYGAYDLCVLDSAAIGIKHNGIVCQSCKEIPILGMCWKCLDCMANCSLCTSCYMVDEHSKQHAFLRVDFPKEVGVQVGIRLGAKKVQSRGIFPGAKVVRGVDWRWNNQDGGEGKEGVVVELRNWKNLPKRGVLVSWDCAKKGTYRLGAKGKVDLKFVKPGTGGFYYKEHLPKMGEWKRKLRRKKTSGAELSAISCKRENPGDNRPVVGDPVCVSLSSDIVKPKNGKFEEWTDDDNMSAGKSGKVLDITPLGDAEVIVRESDCHDAIMFNADALSLVEGGNPPHSTGQFSNPSQRIEYKAEAGFRGDLLSRLFPGDCGMGPVVSNAAGAGDVNVVGNILDNSPHLVNYFEEGIHSPLIRACQEGHSEVATMLLSRGADVNQQDSLGYTALHHASIRDLSGLTARVLVNFGANVNDTRNDASSPPLHLAVKEINSETIRVLLNAGCNMNLLDGQGFTALHHAAHWDTTGTTARLLTDNGADLNNNHNGRRLTPLHVAVQEYNSEAVEVLIKAGCHLNVQDNQGLTALHLSVRSDVSGTIASLLVAGGADVNAHRNEGLLTPLHTAAIEEKVETAHILVQAGCDVNSQDFIGNTAFHEASRRGQLQLADILLDVPSVNLTIRNREGLTAFLVAVIKQFRNIAKKILEKSPNVASIPGHGGLTALHFAALYDNVEILEDLLESGIIDIDAQNKDGLTALDLATSAGKHSAVQTLKRRIGNSRSPVTNLNTGNQKTQPHKKEMSCLGNSATERYGSCEPEQQEACDFRFGDTVQVKKNIQVVEPLQQGHGGWNHGMMRPLGKNGFVEEILDTGDVKISVQESGKQFAIPFIFNPSALVPVFSINDDTKATSPNIVDYMSSEADAGESEAMDPMLEYALISSPLFDLQVDYCDILEEFNHQSASRALLLACKLRWFTKVKEILCGRPTAINREAGDTFVLHVCCFDADLQIVKMLLEAGAELNTRDHNNFTPLHTAAMGDKSGDVTLLLLEKGANPNDNDNTFCVTPLHIAVVRNNVAAVKTLAAISCTDFNLQNCEGDTPLHIATDMGREEIVAMLLRMGATDSGLFNQDGHLPIHLASRKGYERIIRMLVKYSKHEVNLLTRNRAAMAPMHLALKYGHLEVLNALLETNACDCRIVNGAGRNLNDLADPTKYDDLVDLINEVLGQGEGDDIKQRHLAKKPEKAQNNKRKLNKGNKGSPEDACTETRQQSDFLSDEPVTVKDNGIESSEDPQGLDYESVDDEIELSFEKRGDEIRLLKVETLGDVITEGQLQVKGRIGETLEISKDKSDELLRAVLTADSGTVKAILTSWPQVLNRIFHGMTLLHLACCDGVLAIVEKLLELGANLMAKDTNGLTPLQISATRDKTGATAGILLQNGADPDFQSTEAKGTSALHFAALFNNLAVAKQLIRNKCDVNIKDGRGNSPMDHAIDLDHDEIAHLILETRAYDPMLRNAQGLNGCHKATVRGKKSLLKRLLVRSPNIVNEATEDGDMALHLASGRGNQEIAKILMDEGNCTLDARNRSGETPCKVALSNGHNDLARLLWGEHDGIELYEQLFAEMAQPEDTTDEQEQIGYELELSDSETSSVEGSVEPLDIHNNDDSPWRGRVISSTRIPTGQKEREEKSDDKTIQTSQPTTSRAVEETKTGKRKIPRPFGMDGDIPDRLLCCICLDRQKNITFQCGHLNTCEECAQKVRECPECKATITSRLTTYY